MGCFCTPTITLVDLNELAALFVASKQNEACSKNLTLQFEQDENVPSVFGDSILLRHVLNILLNNAMAYTLENGRILVQTLIKRQAQQQSAGIRVSDTGLGISSAELPYIFDRFYRGEAGRASGIPGTGLGLSIAKAIIDQHDGTLEIESTG